MKKSKVRDEIKAFDKGIVKGGKRPKKRKKDIKAKDREGLGRGFKMRLIDRLIETGSTKKKEK